MTKPKVPPRPAVRMRKIGGAWTPCVVSAAPPRTKGGPEAVVPFDTFEDALSWANTLGQMGARSRIRQRMYYGEGSWVVVRHGKQGRWGYMRGHLFRHYRRWANAEYEGFRFESLEKAQATAQELLGELPPNVGFIEIKEKQ